MSFRYIAPAGAPFSAADLLHWGAAMLTDRQAAAGLQRDVCARFGVRHAFLTSTGRAGMTILLRAMRQLRGAGRTEVIVPGYTCYSVAASILKAGLTPRIVDVRPDTLDYDPDALAAADCSRVLAVIATNLYGLPSDMTALERFCRDRDLLLVDDAAQAMGATVAGRWSGTHGDAGLYSFDKGKNVSAIDGGVIVTSSDDLAAAMTDEMVGLDAPPVVDGAKHAVKALVYWVLLRPALYGIPARLPGLGLGQTVFTTEYPLSAPARSQVALARTMLRRLSTFTAARRRNAAALLAALDGTAAVEAIHVMNNAEPAYLRLPLLLPSPGVRDHAIAALTSAGVGATRSYPQALLDVPDVARVAANPDGKTAGARFVADHLLTLPTHPFVSMSDIARSATILSALTRDAGPSRRLACPSAT